VTEDVAVLTRRVTALERSLARWRVVSVGLLLAVVALYVAPQIKRIMPVRVTDSLTSREFRLLSSADGRHVASLWSFGSLPTLTLYDELGKPRTQLDILPDGSPRLYFADANGRIRLRLGTGVDGRAPIEIIDAQGRVTHRVQ